MEAFDEHGPVVEWIQIEISSDMERFLEGDYLWTSDHKELPFFLKKYVLTDPTTFRHFQCILYWKSYQEWKSIHEHDIQVIYKEYEKMVGHLIVSQAEITQNLLINKIYERPANDKQLPQPILIYSLKEVSVPRFDKLLAVFSNALQLWKIREGGYRLIVVGSLESDSALHAYLQKEFTAKLQHKLLKTHYFTSAISQ